MSDYDALRRFYANYVTAKGGVEDPRVREALAVQRSMPTFASGHCSSIILGRLQSTAGAGRR